MTNQSRRRFFRQLSVCASAAPWFQSFCQSSLAAANDDPSETKRFVVIGSSYGQFPEAFFPKQRSKQNSDSERPSTPEKAQPLIANPDFELSEYLKPLQPLRGKFTVIEGLDHGLGGGHKGVSAWLTGFRYQPGVGNRMYSVDRYAADRIGQAVRFPSIPLSLGQSESVSWNKNGVCLRSVGKPQTVFELLFQNRTNQQRKRDSRQIDSNQSVLDAVLPTAKTLRRGLGTEDKPKLDEFINAVDELEHRLKRSSAWLNRPKLKPETLGVSKTPAHADLLEEGGERLATMRAMYDLMLLALRSDSTRVLSLSIPGGNAKFPIEGVGDGYHSLTHHGKDPVKIAQLKLIEAYYVRELTRFLIQLDGIKEGDGSMLDNTTVLFGSGMGNASGHSNRNLPTLVAGGQFKHAGSLIFEPDAQPLCNLFVTLLQQLGIETDSFSRSTGSLRGFV